MRLSVSAWSTGSSAMQPVRGARLLGEAEVVLHDALVSPEVFQ
ncbi:uroporphyrinogen-III C-methyltransferase, partial [Ralstonia pseudosolanacearum]